MTPHELRSRSHQNLTSATQLAETDPDNAAQLAGFAAELRLKARYCTKKKISNFPNSVSKLRASGMGELQTHDLDRLLTLSNAHSITRSPHINWSNISSWRVEHRYQPVGTVDKDHVSKQIADTALLLKTLDYYELIEGLLDIRASLETEWGSPFSVFALEYDGEFANLLVSNSYFWRVTMWEFHPALRARVTGNFDPDIWTQVRDVTPLQLTDTKYHAFSRMQKFFGGIVEVRETMALTHHIKHAVLLSGCVGDPTPRGHVSSCIFR